MTWTSFHRRGEVLRDVIATADARRDGALPWDVEGATTVFADARDLLGALQISWHTRLMGRIERQQAEQPVSLEDAVVRAWHQTYDELTGLRLVLDAHRDDADPAVREVMAKASAKERQTLAVAAGLGNVGPTPDAASLRVGARVEERARATYVPTYATDESVEVGRHAARPSLLDRLRSALAA